MTGARSSRLAAGVSLVLLLATLGIATPAAATLGSSVQIVTPVDGATVHGITTVTVSAASDSGEIDRPATLQLLLGGAAFAGGTADCATRDSDPDPYVCTTSFAWDTTMATGSYTLQAVLVTFQGRTVGSAPITVSIDNRGPMVHIVSPTDNSGVKGATSVTVSGTVDPLQSDQPGRFVLFVDGHATGSTGNCSTGDIDPDPNTCTLSIPWDPKHLVYRHTLRSEFFTLGNRSATSAVVHVQMFSATKTRVYRATQVTSDKPFSAVGTVIPVVGGGAKTTGARVRVVYKPVGSAPQTVVVRVNALDQFSARFVSRGNGTVTATTLGDAYFGSSFGTTKQLSSARIVCKMAHSAVPVGVIDPGSCTIAHLPKGTGLVLQYEEAAGGWQTLATGGSPAGGKIRFGFGSYGWGGFEVRLVAKANPVFVQSWGAPMSVVVLRPNS